MCGIAGIINTKINSQTGERHLRSQLNAIQHRGPDDYGTITNPSIGLYAGMRRLSIIDLEHGQQPMYSSDKSIAVLFNGEIYNYKELKKELIEKGYSFNTESDTEVLIPLYKEYGKNFQNHLRGMFAIFLLDLKEKKVLLIRDHFGQKPVYYFFNNNSFVFSSEMKSFFPLPFVDFTFRKNHLLKNLAWGTSPPHETAFQNIHKLPAGHYLELNLPFENFITRILNEKQRRRYDSSVSKLFADDTMRTKTCICRELMEHYHSDD